MALDHFVTLGRSGLRVSPFCLGTMTFGEDLGTGASVEESTRILDTYLDRGGNFIDTANIYTRGHAEKIVGDHFAQHPHKRRRAVIATKFACNMHAGDPNTGGASRRAIAHQLENSLRRLRTDCIDLYWLHLFDKHTPVDETLRALTDAVRAGKVRYLGFSDVPAWKITEAQLLARHAGLEPLVAVQLEYSLLERTVEAELIPMAEHLGLAVLPWSPLRRGKLARAPKPEDKSNAEEIAVVKKLAEVAEQHAATPAAVALAWLRKKAGVTAPLLGARTVAQLEANLRVFDVRLSDDDMAALDGASRPKLPFPAGLLRHAASLTHGGTRINGETATLHALVPRTDDERY